MTYDEQCINCLCVMNDYADCKEQESVRILSRLDDDVIYPYVDTENIGWVYCEPITRKDITLKDNKIFIYENIFAGDEQLGYLCWMFNDESDEKYLRVLLEYSNDDYHYTDTEMRSWKHAVPVKLEEINLFQGD